MRLFENPCFFTGDITEAMEWLSQVGYTPKEVFKGPVQRTMLITFRDGTYSFLPYYGGDDITSVDYVDCGNDISLFKLLTGVKSDTDYKQWFTCTKDQMIKDNKYLAGDMIFWELDEPFPYDGWEKSSKESLCKRYNFLKRKK